MLWTPKRLKEIPFWVFEDPKHKLILISKNIYNFVQNYFVYLNLVYGGQYVLHFLS